MLAESLSIIPPAPKVHAKDFPGWRLLLGVQRNTVSGLPDYAFDALISRRRVLGFDSLLLSDPDGVRYVLTNTMEKYKRLVSSHSACWPALLPQPQSVGEACRHSPGVKTGASTRRCRRQATHRILALLGGNGLFLSAG